MENQPNVENPLKKAVLLMLVSISITIVGFLLLAFVAVNLPEDSLFRRSGTSKLKNWLPENIDLPPDMILVSEYKSTNRDVADNYPNPTEVLDQLKAWGRIEGFSRLYRARNSCTQAGPRTIRMGVVLHQESSGAQQYMEWYGEADRNEAETYRAIDLGNAGYLISKSKKSLCSDSEMEEQFEVNFRRNQALGIVSITVKEGQDQKEALETVLRLGRVLDECIEQQTAGE